LVRPKLEYCSLYKPGDLILRSKDIDLLGKSAKESYTTRMMITEKGLTYKERLKSWVYGVCVERFLKFSRVSMTLSTRTSLSFTGLRVTRT